MVDANVPKPNMPLPQDSFFSGNNSGNMPYFVGPKKALCVLIKKTATSITGRLSSKKPREATDMIPSSTHLMVMATRRLLKRSAKKPPAMENKTNGSANTMLTRGTNESRFSMDNPIPTIKKMTRNLRVLSLNAFWNSTTNMSQKLRMASGVPGLPAGVRVSVTGTA